MKTYQELNEELSKLARSNEQLVKSLTKAREQIVQLRSDLESLADPPSSFGTFVAKVEDNQIDILHNGRKLRVLVAPDVDVEALTQGQEVRLNENLIAVEALTHETTGFVATAVEQLEDSRVLVQVHADEQRVMNVVPELLDSRINRGDHLMVDPKSALVLEVLERKEVADLILEHIPDVSYSDIGGLGDQIDAIRDAIEMPFLHQELFHEYGLRPPKGVLLYGPPGCGKTMIAKAVAHELALKAARQRGQDPSEVVNRSWFLNVKGPEILNKYVGETERSIRLVFERAREKASSGNPVVVFFDEMDSLFRTRGSGVSSDVESTVVPQLLAEIDGVESLENVIVIGASNREDMIDPAIVRPGRLDVKIRIERPGPKAGAEILRLYLTHDVPLAEELDVLVDFAIERIYARDDDMAYVDLEYADGTTEVLYFAEFMSGAMLRNIVDRAKKLAIKTELSYGERGISRAHLLEAIHTEFKENEDLPSTANPDDWARVSGRRGQRITRMTPRRAASSEEVAAS